MRLAILCAGLLALCAMLWFTPAGASERTDCVSQVLAENSLTPAAARRIPAGTHIAYQGRDMGALPAGGSIWTACGHYPALAQALDERAAALLSAGTAHLLYEHAEQRARQLAAERDALRAATAARSARLIALNIVGFASTVVAILLAALYRRSSLRLMRAQDELATLKSKLNQATAAARAYERQCAATIDEHKARIGHAPRRRGGTRV